MEIMQGTYKGKEFTSADVQSNFGNSITISLHGCPYCLSRYQKQTFLAETQDSFGEEYLYGIAEQNSRRLDLP